MLSVESKCRLAIALFAALCLSGCCKQESVSGTSELLEGTLPQGQWEVPFVVEASDLHPKGEWLPRVDAQLVSTGGDPAELAVSPGVMSVRCDNQEREVSGESEVSFTRFDDDGVAYAYIGSRPCPSGESRCSCVGRLSVHVPSGGQVDWSVGARMFSTIPCFGGGDFGTDDEPDVVIDGLETASTLGGRQHAGPPATRESEGAWRSRCAAL